MHRSPMLAALAFLYMPPVALLRAQQPTPAPIWLAADTAAKVVTLDNAMTRMVTAGLKAGQEDVTTFVADQAGWYWLLCGVPGHALKGEWVGLRVDPDARMPAVREKR